MSGILRFSEANPVRIVITSWQNRNANDRDYKFFRDISLPGFDSFFQPFLQSDSLSLQFDSSFDSTNVVTLKNYYTGATVQTPTVNEIVDNTTYKVYESDFSIGALNGVYYIEVTGSDTDAETYIAQSEPIEIRASFCRTVQIAYYNNEPAFGVDYRSEVTFNLRVYAFFNRTSDPSEREVFTDTGGNKSLINGIITRSRFLKAERLLPQWMIEKVNLALIHDSCEIDGVAVAADNSWPYELISDRALWAEPEASITLASGSNRYMNTHDSGSRETL